MTNKINLNIYNQNSQVTNPNIQTRISSTNSQPINMVGQRDNNNITLQNVETYTDNMGREHTTGIDENGNIVDQYRAGNKFYTVTTFNDGHKEEISKYNIGGMECEKTIIYNQENKKVKETTNRHQTNGKDFTEIVNYEYYDNGQLKSEKKVETNITDNIIIKESLTLNNERGIKIEYSERSHPGGKDYLEHYKYDNEGNITFSKIIRYINGVKTEITYDGANLAQRMGVNNNRFASEIIQYEQDDKTIKRRVVNHFDENGVYTGREVTENGETRKDTFELDGKIDLAMQAGRGDCYLLAAINSLAGTALESKVFGENVEKIVDPQTGKIKYRVKLPGSEKTRQDLINGKAVQGLGKLSADKVFLQEYYEITEEELNEAAKKAGEKYSYGDRDVLLMEVAYEKYRKAVFDTIQANPNKPKLYDVQGFGIFERNNQHVEEGDYLSSGKTYDAIYVMTGVPSQAYLRKPNDVPPTVKIDEDGNITLPNDNSTLATKNAVAATYTNEDKNRDKLIDEIIKDYAVDGQLNNHLVTCSMLISKQTINGRDEIGKGHAFTIVGMSANEVKIANPWYPDKIITMTMEDFKKACAGLYVTKISTGRAPQTTPRTEERPSQPETHEDTGEITQYTVPRGKGYTELIKEALTAQGIPLTPENIRLAKEQFEKANPGAVHTYRGPRRQWRGNRYLYAGAQVNIPKFDINLNN